MFDVNTINSNVDSTSIRLKILLDPNFGEDEYISISAAEYNNLCMELNLFPMITVIIVTHGN